MKSLTYLTPNKVVQALFWLRNFAVLGQIIVVMVAFWGLSLTLPLVPLAASIAALALWNAAVYWRLTRAWPATHLEILLHLAIDATAFAFILYWTGGATNPFVSLYLVPIAIAAAALSAWYVGAISLLCVVYYSLLMIFYVPVPPIHEDLGGDYNVHIFGMWVNFLLSAVLMAVSVAAIAGAVRRRDQALSSAREAALANEKIVALGTLSAGVSHEISTPLSTMTMLVEELKTFSHRDPLIQDDLDLLGKQLDLCKHKIGELLDQAGQSRSEAARSMSLRQFMVGVLDQFRVVRPDVELSVTYREPFQNPIILAEQTIAQSLTNLLNNAADASLENQSGCVDVTLDGGARQLLVQIDDHGPGISQQQTEQAGRVSFSTKDTGFGLGLILSNASLARFGGDILLESRAEGGTRTQIRLPLADLIISDPDRSAREWVDAN